jgi:Ser/Thr protein kinase RdoA (MazF antagonist)
MKEVRMPKLNPSDHPTIAHEFLEQILERYGIRSFTYESAASGIANTTLLINSDNKGQVVLRIYQRNRTLQDIRLELAFTEMLKNGGIPIASIQSDIRGRQIGEIEAEKHEWYYILMDFIGGAHADKYTPTLIKNLARIQAKMHILGATFSPHDHQPIRGPKKLIETFNTRINRKEIDDAATRTFLDRARDFTVMLPASLPSGYNHLDYDADNVLVSDDKITAVLDFDDLEYTPIVMCLGYTLWDILDETGDIEQVRAYLAEYEQLRPLSKEEIDWLQPVIMFRNYVIGVIDVQFYGNESERIDHCIALESVISEISSKDLALAGSQP